MKGMTWGGIFLCLLQVPANAADPAQSSDWVKFSNAEADPILKVLAKYSPEARGTMA
jgi:hypothetical protein